MKIREVVMALIEVAMIMIEIKEEAGIRIVAEVEILGMTIEEVKEIMIDSHLADKDLLWEVIDLILHLDSMIESREAMK